MSNTLNKITYGRPNKSEPTNIITPVLLNGAPVAEIHTSYCQYWELGGSNFSAPVLDDISVRFFDGSPNIRIRAKTRGVKKKLGLRALTKLIKAEIEAKYL